MIRRLAFAALVILGGALPAAAGYQEGLRALETGDYATAYREFHPLAQQGYSDAQFALGQMYRFGTGVAQDDAKAFAWFHLAGKAGHTEAQTFLGFAHSYGVGTERDAFRAYFWFSLAATGANSRAEANRDRMARSLSAAQRAEADKLVDQRRRQVEAMRRGSVSTAEPKATEATSTQDKPAAPTASLDAFQVQLGAYQTADHVPAFWRRLRAAHPVLLGGLRQRVQHADSGSRVLHLLQVGPLIDAEAAKALCAALTARSVDCLVVRP